MTIRSTLLASALILSAIAPASAAGDNVVLIDVGKVRVPAKLPGQCRLNGAVNQVWQGRTFHEGEMITIAVPCNSGTSGYLTPVQAVRGWGVHFIAADVLVKTKRGLARVDDAGALIWQPSGRTYGPWGVAMGFRVLDAASVPVPGRQNP